MTEQAITIKPGGIAGPVSVSMAQYQTWAIDHDNATSARVKLSAQLRWLGVLDFARLSGAIEQLVARHHILRSQFLFDGKSITQVPLPEYRVEINEYDYAAYNPTQQQQEQDRIIADLNTRRYHLGRDVLCRVAVVKCGEKDYTLLFNLHRIAADQWSLPLIIREICQYYQAGEQAAMAELSLQFGDYAHWQWQRQFEDDWPQQLQYWSEYLDDISALHQLLPDMPRARKQGFMVDVVQSTIDVKLSGQLRHLAGQHGVSLTLLLQTAFAALIHRYSNDAEIVLGVWQDGRLSDALKPLIGPFATPLVTRHSFEQEQSLLDCIIAQQQQQKVSNRFSQVPVVQLADLLMLPKAEGFHRVFQLGFALFDAVDMPSLPGVSLEPPEFIHLTSELDLCLQVYRQDGRLKLQWCYDSGLFNADTVERLARSLTLLLQDFVAQPQLSMDRLKLMDEAQQQQLLEAFKPVLLDYPPQQTIDALFEFQAKQHPQRVALIHQDEQLTYAELNRQADQLAGHLRASGISHGEPVLICCHRSNPMVIAILAILKAGAMYVPADVLFPASRIGYILKDSKARFIVTETDCSGLFDDYDDGQKTLVCLDSKEVTDCLAGNAYPPSQRNGDGSDHAFIVYTSGSTGNPKGVVATHKNMLRLIVSCNPYLDYPEPMSCVFGAPVAFDAAMFELYCTLLNGGLLINYGPGVFDLAKYNQLVEQHQLNVMWLTSGLFEVWVDSIPEGPSSVRSVWTGGDIISPTAVGRLYQKHPDIVVMNMYGPTETATFVTCYPVPRDHRFDRPIPIGSAMANAALLVMSKSGQPVPLGAVGELYIGGDGVTVGYLNQPKLTAEKFVGIAGLCYPRWYRSGDLVRWMGNGLVDFVSRIDDQVKISGYRIEPGEVEIQLLACRNVENAVVMVRDEPKRLVGYVVLQSDQTRVEDVQAELAAKVPEYMVPAALVVIDEIPLTGNGKTDRRALPAPEDLLVDDDRYVAPENETQRKICEIWQQVLKLEKVGIAHRFDELGGQSLLATRVNLSITKHFGVALTIAEFINHQTVAQLAELVDSRKTQEPTPVSVMEILALCEKHDIKLGIKQDQLRVRKGKNANLTKQLTALLKANKEELLQWLKEQGSAKSQRIVPVDRSKHPQIPLTLAQVRLWFIDELEGGSSQYNIPFALKLEGNFDPDAFKRAIHTIIERHQVLRSRIISHEGEAYQEVVDEFELTVEMIDLSHLDKVAQEAEVTRLADEDAVAPFDIAKDLMLRVKLLKQSNQLHVMLLNIHHIASDGWSVNVLVGELTVLYEAYSKGRSNPLPALEIQYADYAFWQRNWLKGAVLQKHLDYWKHRLAGIPQVHQLPLDNPRPKEQTFNGGYAQQVIEGSLVKRIRNLCRSHDATLFMVLLSAFDVLIARYSDADDIIIGSPIAGRTHHEIEPLIGFFVNTLVLRAEIDTSQPFSQLVTQNKRTILEAYDHQTIPFEMLLTNELKLERSLSHSPVFQIMFAVQNNEKVALEMTGVQLQPVMQDSDVVKFDMDVTVSEYEDIIVVGWTYNVDLFEQASIVRFAESYEALLEGIVDNPNTLIGDLPIQSVAACQSLLQQWNNQYHPLGQGLCVQQLFERQAASHPELTALVMGDQQMDYAELNRRANRLAHYLIEQGVGPDKLVGICLNRSFELVVGLMAIVKAGGAYVPLDPKYPESRLTYMLADSAIDLVLCETALVDVLPLGDTRALCLDEQSCQQPWVGYSEANPQTAITPSHLAYVIYTSGTTGQPKGVAIEQRNWVSYAQAALLCYGIDEPLRMLGLSSISFDIFVEELSLTLLAGGQLVLDARGLEMTSGEFWQQVDNHGINAMTLPTAYWHLLNAELDEQSQAICRKHLKFCIVGGEELSGHATRQWYERVGRDVVLWNTYGPTEGTVIASIYDTRRYHHTDGRPPSIGTALGNTLLYILDGKGNVCPQGVSGQLHIGGDGVARGYLNQAKTTAEKFIDNPFGPGRLYKTGDRVCWSAQGNIEFLGRIDNQVKIRGLRIELGEIETQLTALDGIESAVVLACGEQQQLVAYLVADGEGPVIEDIRQTLKQQLPAFMVPALFMYLDALPLTANGKLDKKALPKADTVQQQVREYVAPDSEIESKLCEIWQQLLGLEQVGVTDNFFEIGGHSLLAVRMIARIHSEFNVELGVRSIFDSQSIRALAKVIEQGEHSEHHAIEKAPDNAPLPLSFAQQRLWFIDKLEGGSSQYNMPFAFKVEGEFDVDLFERALSTVVERHHVLRTRLVAEGETVYQQVQQDYQVKLTRVDLSEHSERQQQQQVSRLSQADGVALFDLKSDLLIRSSCIKLTEQHHVLLINMHHIASDGWSLNVLLSELGILYTRFAAGKNNPLPPLMIQYGDYAYWQRRYFGSEALQQELQFWQQRLAGIAQVHQLPLDKVRPPKQTFNGQHHQQLLAQSLTEQIAQLCREHDVTLFMLMHTAFSLLLCRYSRTDDIVMGTPIAGRQRAELEPMIGFFVNTLVLRAQLDMDSGFGDILHSNRQDILDAFSNQNVPFDMLVEELNPVRSLSHSPLFQIMFSVHNLDKSAAQAEPGGFVLEAIGQSNTSVKFDLELTVMETEQGLAVNWSFNGDLFEMASIARMADSFELLLKGIASDKQRPVSQLPLLDTQQRKQLLDLYNDTAEQHSEQGSIGCLFAATAEQQPDEIALSTAKGAVSYSQLNAKANRLARYLVAHGVVIESRVGIRMNRSIDMVVAMMAVLKAGGAYVPMDPAYPQSRIDYIAKDAQTTLVLDDNHEVFSDPAVLSGYSELSPDIGILPGNLAYIIYTSGSTGLPKGVSISHHNAVAMINWGRDYFSRGEMLGCLEKVVACTSICFDLSVFELFLPLIDGGEVLLVENAVTMHQHPSWQQATLLNTVPSAIDALVAVTVLPDSVKVVNLAGEPLAARTVRKIYSRSKVVCVCNLYGPSEDTTYSTAAMVAQDESLPAIGHTISNTRAYILDEQLEPVPLGTVGQLYLSGDGVTRGYFAKAAQTATVYLPNPFESDGSRMYNTGDLVRRRNDGQMTFVGRVDHQVKVRGYRMELGEIEYQLGNIPQVESAVVLAKGEPKSLVAYVVLQSDQPQQVTRQTLKDALLKGLPDYMVPAIYVFLDAMPLTPNGKIDRKQLPEPDTDRTLAGQYQAPQNEIEADLCDIWQKLLGLQRVGRNDNFFDIGGHSLLATRLVSAVEAHFHVELAIREVFEQQTVADLANVIATGARTAAPPIVPVERNQRLPLSYAQQRLWFIDSMEQGSRQYNMPFALKCPGPFDRQAFGNAVDTIISRHEVLRSCLRKDDEGAYQHILQQYQSPISDIDISAIDAASQDAEVTRIAAEQGAILFDLSNDILLRVAVVKLDEQLHVLLFNMHHAASDGWSINVLLNELNTLYQAYSKGEENPLPPLVVQYVDYAHWQRNWLSGDVLQAQLDYWRARLELIPVVHQLPLDKVRPSQQSFNGAQLSVVLEGSICRQLTQLCRDADVTLFMLIYSAFSLFLSRYSNSDDIVVGTPIAGRTKSELEPLIGFFVNTLVLRCQPDMNQSFLSLLQDNKRHILDAFSHQAIAFDYLVEQLSPGRSLSHTPLFQIMFSVENRQAQRGSSGSQMAFEAVEFGGEVAAKFDLEFNLVDGGDAMLLQWTYNTDLFEKTSVERMNGAFEQLLRSIVADPMMVAGELSLLSDADTNKLLQLGHGVECDDGLSSDVVTAFEYQAGLQPQALAVCDNLQSLNYAELNRRANRLAHCLIAQDVVPESRVGIRLERSVDKVIAMLAVLKAGAVYVPVDTRYPQARQQQIIEDARPLVVIDDNDVWGKQALMQYSSENPGLELLPAQGAYMIYTSGTTGKPKGVLVEHLSLYNLVHWYRDYAGVSHVTRGCQTASFGFDASTFEIWCFITFGAALHILPDDLRLDTKALAQWLADEKITHGFLPTPLAEALLHHEQIPDSLMVFSAGGDQLKTRPVAGQNFTMLNLYGPTECSVVATSGEVIAEGVGLPSIGGPIDNGRCYVLDKNLQLSAPGQIGELYIGGMLLGRGYFGLPGVTAASFVPDPFSVKGAERMYATGDMVRWRCDGSLEYLGRRDQQVKIRGFRIELQEISSALAGLEGIDDCAVICSQDERRNKFLVAYVVASQPDFEQYKTQLRQALPDYMVPSYWMHLEALPLTANGKLDKRALPRPALDETSSESYVAPRDEVEADLCQIWQSLLNLERVSVEDNFFDLGGHSLLVTRMVSSIRAHFHVDVAIKAVFEQPTIAGIARLVSAGDLVAEAEIKPMSRSEGEEKLPLSFAQQRLWFIHRLEGGSSQYNIPFDFAMSGQFDMVAFQQALAAVIERHHVLRSRIFEVEGEAFQQLNSEYELPVTMCDLSALPAAQQQQQVALLSKQNADYQFDLTQGLMLKVAVLKLAQKHHLILFNMHHIASDGWSMTILLDELKTLYEAFKTGADNPLAPLKWQYGDYAKWQRDSFDVEQQSAQIDYWKKRLQGLPQVHQLPLDYPRPQQQGVEGLQLVLPLASETAVSLHQMCRKLQVTPFIALQSAFAVLLGRYSHSSDVVMGTPVSGRNRKEFEAVIGFFVNTLVLRSEIDWQHSFSDMLQCNRRNILDDFAHQAVGFDTLVDHLQVSRSLSHAPVFQIMFSVQNLEQGNQAAADPAGNTRETAVKFDLEVTIELSPNSIDVAWSYNRAIFAAQSIEQMAQAFAQLLGSIVAAPDTPLLELSMVSDTQRLHSTKSGVVSSFDSHLCLHQLIEHHAQTNPQALAVTDETQSFDYARFNHNANRLAHWLIANGIVRGSRVGILLPRSVAMIMAMVAVHKAGGIYVPMDISYPQTRLDHIAGDAGLSVIIDQNTPLDESSLETYSEQNPDLPQHSGQGAYIIYTSGTTGKPKGVLVSHKAVHNLVCWHNKQRQVTVDSRSSQLASIGFDASGQEVWPYLCAGASVHIVPDELRLQISHTARWLAQNQITHCMMPTPLAEALVQSNAPTGQLAYLLTGGEKLKVRPQAKSFCLVNHYGPTECTIVTTAAEVDPNGSGLPPIGEPVDNAQVFILDSLWQPVAPGEPGELFIAGTLLAEGYWADAAKTAVSFVPNPFSGQAGQRMYASGDLVRLDCNGDLEFLGRIDEQVKIRGFRIELAEIIAVISGFDGVEECTVLCLEDDNLSKHLVAYVVGESGRLEQWQKSAEQALPDYMVPSVWQLLDELPLTSNDKVDRKALPKPDFAARGRCEYVAPSNSSEQALCEIWQTVLGHDKVSTEDNFFAIGGHSMLVVKLTLLIEARFEVAMPPVMLFKHQTVKEQAGWLMSQSQSGTMQALAEGADAEPIFMVPGLGGQSFIFDELAKQLSTGHRVYGLDALGIDGSQPPHTTIEQVAEYNASLVVKSCQGQSCILLGHSLGAAVVHHMVGLLQAQGICVSQAILLDGATEFPGAGDVPAHELSASLLNFMLDALHMGSPLPMHELLALDEQQQLIKVATHIQAEQGSGKLDMAWLAHHLAVLKAQARMIYHATELLDTKVTVIQASESTELGHLGERWQPLCVAEIDYYVIKGSHHLMLTGTSLAELLVIVRKVLQADVSVETGII